MTKDSPHKKESVSKEESAAEDELEEEVDLEGQQLPPGEDGGGTSHEQQDSSEAEESDGVSDQFSSDSEMELSDDSCETGHDIDILRLSPQPFNPSESAADRVKRELASDMQHDFKKEDDTNLSKLASLVNNIDGSKSPPPPPPLVKAAPQSPSHMRPGSARMTSPEAAKVVKPRPIRANSSPVLPSKDMPPFPAAFHPLALSPNIYQHHLKLLAERYKVAESGLPSTSAAHLMPSPELLPTWPSPPLAQAAYGINQPGLIPWMGSPSRITNPFAVNLPLRDVHPSLLTQPPKSSVPPPDTPAASSKERDQSLSVSPLDLSGGKNKASPSGSTNSDLASPLSDTSIQQTPEAKRRLEDEPLNLVKRFRTSEDSKQPLSPKRLVPPHVPSPMTLPPALASTNAANNQLPFEVSKKEFQSHPAFASPEMAVPMQALPGGSICSNPFLGLSARLPFLPAGIPLPFIPSAPTSSPCSSMDSREEIENTTKRRKFLSPESVRVLNEWYSVNKNHPYPNDETVEFLAEKAGISIFQVKKWMANKRVRSCNTLAFNGSIHPKKLQKLMQLRENENQGSVSNSSLGSGAAAFEEKPDSSADVKSRTPSSKGKGNRFLDPAAVDCMNKWYVDHLTYPYPTEDEKRAIAKDAGISVAQVTCWFANKRNRNNNTKKISTKNAWPKGSQKMRFMDANSNGQVPLEQFPVLPGFPGHPYHQPLPFGLPPQRK